MEVEAKFGIPDEQTGQRLLQLGGLGGFSLDPAQVVGLQDTYLDTPDRAMLAGGYACRLRREPDRFILTLKGMGQATGALHRREEHEIELPGLPAPAARDWPPGAARDLAVELTAGRPIEPLFVIDQVRHDRVARDGDRLVAQVSVQRVHLLLDDLPDPAASYMEMEAELLPDGRDDDLARIADELENTWHLPPEKRSKFERGLAILDGDEAPDLPPDDGDALDTLDAPPPVRLSPAERAVVERLTGAPELMARRARLLLAWDDGLPRAELLARSKLSARRARHWLLTFRTRRLGIFPGRVLRAATLPPEAEPAAAEPASAPRTEPEPEQPPSAPRTEPAGEPEAEQKTPGIDADEPMSEAGRKTLRFHFRRMRAQEPGVRLGEDPEAVHDMRVATRRMRAALRLFGPYFDPDAIAPLESGLRRAGRALGAVRDLDVFREKVEDYAGTLPIAQRGSLAPLLAALDVRRTAARDELLAYLDGKKYARLTERLAEFVDTEGLGSLPARFDGPEPTPYRVRHVAPATIYERLAAVRAFDEWVSVPSVPVTRLHALRIAGKRLRYTLEFFREVLDPGSKAVINQVVGLQDHLGALQDAVVASAILRDFLVWGTWGDDLDRRSLPDLDAPVIAPGVAAYLAVKQSELQQLLDSFPALWARFQDVEFSRHVAEVVSVL